MRFVLSPLSYKRTTKHYRLLRLRILQNTLLFLLHQFLKGPVLLSVYCSMYTLCVRCEYTCTNIAYCTHSHCQTGVVFRRTIKYNWGWRCRGSHSEALHDSQAPPQCNYRDVSVVLRAVVHCPAVAQCCSWLMGQSGTAIISRVANFQK